MEQKKCTKCGRLLPISEFYRCNHMTDGHFNTCKDCTKERVKENYLKNIENPEYVEKERARGREKYRRLYADKHKKSSHNENKCTRAFLKRRGIDCEGYEVHHWNYNEKNNVFLLEPRMHKKVHRELTFDAESQKFIYKGDILQTKEQHENAIREILQGCVYDLRYYKLQ